MKGGYEFVQNIKPVANVYVNQVSFLKKCTVIYIALYGIVSSWLYCIDLSHVKTWKCVNNKENIHSYVPDVLWAQLHLFGANETLNIAASEPRVF